MSFLWVPFPHWTCQEEEERKEEERQAGKEEGRDRGRKEERERGKKEVWGKRTGKKRTGGNG